MKGLIYKFLNSLNNKVYIGQTISELNVRVYHHYYLAFNKQTHNKFYNALRKYGKDNFTVSILYEINEEDPSILIDILNDYEKKYIEQYNSIKKGYNTQDGGRGFRDEQERGKSISNSKINKPTKRSNIIELYDFQGTLIATYQSAMLAERAVGGDNGHILRVCRGLRKTHKGFIWKFGHIKSDELPEHLED